MKINYIYRSKKLNAYSIENVFDCISDELAFDNEVQKSYLPEGTYKFKAFLKNLKYMKNNKADIFHITGDVHYICAALPGIKTVLTIHDLRAHERLANKKIKKWIYDLIWVKYPLKKCRYVTAISDKTREELVGVCPWAKEKIFVIPNPINYKIKKKSKEFNKKQPRLLFLGTKDNKNHIRMIEAVKSIDCIIDIVGKIPSEEIIALKENRIIYENSFNLSEENLIKKYEESDIVMFASTYEGFGMPIIEGQMVGRPVLTSNISPMKEVAGNNGACLVDPFDVDSIREGLLRIINDDNYRDSLVIQGFKNAEKYEAKNVASMYRDLYIKMTNKMLKEI